MTAQTITNSTKEMFDDVRTNDSNPESQTVNVDEFKAALRTKYGDDTIDNLPEGTVDNLFAQADSDKNKGQLSLKEFQAGMKGASAIINSSDTTSTVDFTSTSDAANRLLTGDIDQKVEPEVVDEMVNRGYLEVKNGELLTTQKGDELLGYADDSSYGLEGKQIQEHMFDYEADQNGVTQGNGDELMEMDMFNFSEISPEIKDFLDMFKESPQKYQVLSLIQMDSMKVVEGELQLTETGNQLAEGVVEGRFSDTNIASAFFDFQTKKQ